jgi:peptidoglycan hydrolase-like protein with peptidoglycan-binding domain
MVPRKSMRRGLALLVMAGLSVFARAGEAQSQAPSSKAKTPPSKTNGTSGKNSHRSSKKVNSRRKEKGQKAPTPDRISQIQEALAKDGSFSNAPNGKWDDATVEAMRKFQGSHGLNPSGKLDALTLEKLGLGSQTAGVAEPVAPPNSSSRLTNSPAQSARP